MSLQRIRVMFTHEPSAPTAIPGQMISATGTSVWPIDTHNSQIKLHSKSCSEFNSSSCSNSRHSPTTTYKNSSLPSQQISSSSSSFAVKNCKINGHFDLHNYRENFIHINCNEKLHDPYLFAMEWLVWFLYKLLCCVNVYEKKKCFRAFC